MMRSTNLFTYLLTLQIFFACFCVSFVIITSLIVGTSADSCLEGLFREVSYNTSSGALNQAR